MALLLVAVAFEWNLAWKQGAVEAGWFLLGQDRSGGVDQSAASAIPFAVIARSDSDAAIPLIGAVFRRLPRRCRSSQ
jgi:hypothetical protein